MNKGNSDVEKYYNHLDHQDWNTIVVKKNKNKDKDKVESNKKNTTDVKAKKLEKKVEDDDLKHKKIPNDLKQKIIVGRCSKKMTQKELAQKLNKEVLLVSAVAKHNIIDLKRTAYNTCCAAELSDNE